MNFKYLILIIVSIILIIGGIFFYPKLLLEIKAIGSEVTEDSVSTKDIHGIITDDLKCIGCNLVIISLTNTRKDHIGIYGYERDTTPNIDKFFKNSLVFENAFAPASWTLPVIASFFSSQFPYKHKVMDRYKADGNLLSEDILTMPEIFKENGYKTMAFTGGGDHNSMFGIGQGFDEYDTFEGETGSTLSSGPSEYKKLENSMPQSLEWLKKNNRENFFFFLQGYDTHCPFLPKEPFDKKFDPNYKGIVDYSTCLWTFEQTKPIYENGEKYWPVKTWYSEDGVHDVRMSDRDVEYMVALYDGEIASADDYLKEFFSTVNELGLEKNTIFIFMSEHGDLFGEHGRFMRGGPLRGTFYDPVLNFPLLIKHPNVRELIKVDALIQTVDLMPTLLEMFELSDSQKETRQGQSILSSIIDGNEINEYIYAGSQFNGNGGSDLFFSGLSKVETIRNKEWKLIKEEIYNTDTGGKKEESYELYNIMKDPKEEKNLYDDESERSKDLTLKLEEWALGVKNK